MTTFARFSEHPEAGRLLDAALREGPAHAYLFHGPPGVGKREVARTFARALVETEREFHPDIYELEALGEMIRIDAIRELRRDLHMRPFEADRRVYLIQRAQLMNDDAFDALLKDLEEPPSYAVIVLIADDLGSIPETIRSRCQLVPFRRLSERAMRDLVDVRAPELDDDARASLARVAAGRLDRLERLLDPTSRSRREALLEQARAPYRSERFDPTDAADVLIANAQARAAEARETEEARIADLDLSTRDADQRVKRARAAPSARSCSRSSRSSPRGTATSLPSPSAPRAPRSISTSSCSCVRTRRASESSGPSTPPRRCATRGARSRS